MMIAAVLLLMISVAGATYAYVAYPIRLKREGRRRTLIVQAKDIEPPITLIIPVHNRESVIEQKLLNTLALDYPSESLEILVASDGSTDRTESIVKRFADRRVRLLPLPRSGKLVALQQAARRAHGEILVFTDANVSLDPAALRRLVRNFADSIVGGVVGRTKVRRSRNGDGTGLGELLFARYEAWLNWLESRVGSVHAASAALYGVRRELFVPARNLAQADDIAISSPVVLAGKRLVYEPRAVCWKLAPADGAREFRRKVQVVNYTTRAVLELNRRLLRNRSWGTQLFSRTIARYLVPFFLLGALTASAVLATAHVAFLALAGAQLVLIGLAALGWLLRDTRLGATPLLALPCWFGAINLAALLGVIAVLRGYRPTGAKPPALGERRAALLAHVSGE